MLQIFHILRYKFLAFVKIQKNLSLGIITRSLGASLVYIAFAVGTYIFSHAILQYTLTQTKIGLFLLHQFISMALFVFFVTVNIGNIIVSYSTLYKSGEVTYLMTKPVQPAKIFLIKFLDNFFYSSATLIMILLSAILAYAHYFKLGFFTTAAVILFDFLPFIFSAGLIGVLILLLVLRVATRIGLKPVILVLATGYFFVFFGFFRGTSPIRLVNAVLEHYPDVNQYFGNLLPLGIKLLPNNWLASSLFWIVKGNLAESARYIFYQFGFCLVFLGVTLFLGYRLYYKTWLSLPALKSHRSQNRLSDGALFAQSSIFAPRTEAILKRDLLNFVREPSQIVHFAVIIFLILIFVGSLTRVSLLGARNTQLQTLIYLTVYSFNAFLISSLALRFVYPLISLEGPTFWRLRSAPIPAHVLMNRKLLPFFVIVLIAGEFLSYFSNYHFSRTLTVVGALVIVCMSSALTSLNFGMGGAFANYSEKSPIRISSSQGATLSFLLSLIYIVFVIALLMFPIKIYFEDSAAGIAGFALFRNALIIITIVSVIITIHFYRMGLRSFRRDF